MSRVGEGHSRKDKTPSRAVGTVLPPRRYRDNVPSTRLLGQDPGGESGRRYVTSSTVKSVNRRMSPPNVLAIPD